MEKQKEELPRYLTEKEVSRMTGRSLSTLRSDRFKCQGLPYVKISRSVSTPSTMSYGSWNPGRSSTRTNFNSVDGIQPVADTLQMSRPIY